MTSTEQNQAIARRSFEEAYNRGNLRILDELYVPDFVGHPPVGEDIHGPAAVKEVIVMFRTAFPDFQFVIEDMIAAGDMVVTRATISGSHEGEFQGIAPTGRRMRITGIVIDRIVDGRKAEAWGVWDIHGMVRQIGAGDVPNQTGK